MTGIPDRWLASTAAWAPAWVGRVEATLPDRGRLRVRGAEGTQGCEVECLASVLDAVVDDEVLVQPAGDRAIAVGIIARGGGVRRAHTPKGIAVAIEGETVTVRDAGGGLLFEHRAAEGRTVVGVPAGDLEFSVPTGALSLRAANGVSVQTPAGISLASGSTVTLSAAKPADETTARIVLDPVSAEITAPCVGVTAARAVVHTEDAELVARAVRNTVDSLQVVAGVIETRAQRVVERARNVYRDVENLAQTRAGRIRMVAREALHAGAKRLHLHGEDEVKLRGEKVYLG